LVKKNPRNAQNIIMGSNEYLKYLPVDKNATSMLSPILDFTAKEAKVAAAIRAQLEKAGTPIDPFDILIGATALANQSTLVTHNIKEFSRIDKLSIEDWYR